MFFYAPKIVPAYTPIPYDAGQVFLVRDDARAVSLRENVAERGLKLRVFEGEAGCEQLYGFHSLAGQEQFLAHFAEDQPHGEAWQRENRRPS